LDFGFTPPWVGLHRFCPLHRFAHSSLPHLGFCTTTFTHTPAFGSGSHGLRFPFVPLLLGYGLPTHARVTGCSCRARLPVNFTAYHTLPLVHTRLPSPVRGSLPQFRLPAGWPAQHQRVVPVTAAALNIRLLVGLVVFTLYRTVSGWLVITDNAAAFCLPLLQHVTTRLLRLPSMPLPTRIAAFTLPRSLPATHCTPCLYAFWFTLG